MCSLRAPIAISPLEIAMEPPNPTKKPGSVPSVGNSRSTRSNWPVVVLRSKTNTEPCAEFELVATARTFAVGSNAITRPNLMEGSK